MNVRWLALWSSDELSKLRIRLAQSSIRSSFPPVCMARRTFIFKSLQNRETYVSGVLDYWDINWAQGTRRFQASAFSVWLFRLFNHQHARLLNRGDEIVEILCEGLDGNVYRYGQKQRRAIRTPVHVLLSLSCRSPDWVVDGEGSTARARKRSRNTAEQHATNIINVIRGAEQGKGHWPSACQRCRRNWMEAKGGASVVDGGKRQN